MPTSFWPIAVIALGVVVTLLWWILLVSAMAKVVIG
jgi:hypothetical protein